MIKEERSLAKGLRKFGKRAYNAALASGVSVSVMKGNNVCLITPDGKVSVVERRAQTKCKVSQKTFKLK